MIFTITADQVNLLQFAQDHDYTITPITGGYSIDTGIAEPTGLKGDKGDQGIKGERGIQGETGAQGIQGATGATGAKGDKGDKGDQGIQGIPGDDTTFVYSQMVASDQWEITHSLNKYPSIDVVDSSGNVVMGDYKYIDNNRVVLTFNGSFSGNAYLN